MYILLFGLMITARSMGDYWLLSASGPDEHGMRSSSFIANIMLIVRSSIVRAEKHILLNN